MFEKSFAKGFTRLPNEVLLDSELSLADLAVYWAVRSFMYGTRTTWAPGYDAIAQRAHCSKKTARISVNRLEDRGWLIVHRRQAKATPGSGRPPHVIEIVQNRQAFLKDRDRRDQEHAKRLQKEAHQQGLQVQQEALQGRISHEEANRVIRQIQEGMNRRSRRIPVDGVTELEGEATDGADGSSPGKEVA